MKTKVNKPLWFAKSFGLDLQSAVFVDKHGGNHTLSYSEKVLTSYKDLSEVDQEKVKSVMFTLDKFCIDDAAYHELPMVFGNADLLRSYLIKDKLNKMSHHPYARIDIMVELESVIQNQVCSVV